MIHADFLLTANRGDIDHSLTWNRFLRGAMVSAIGQAILVRFVRSVDPELSFGWPQYLTPARSMPASFLKSIAAEIIASLSEQACVFSEKGQYEKPAMLVIVPEAYRWTNGDLVLDHGNLPWTSLSKRYPEKALPGLRCLGVRDMTFSDFISAFRSLLDEDGGEYFRQQSQEWHSKVAEILLRGIQQAYWPNGTAADYLGCGSYSIIPLRDGKWASVNSGSLFIEETGKDLAESVPRGIGNQVKVVDQEAASDLHRRKLFLALGVKKCEEQHICNLILKAHSMTTLPGWSKEDCISHAAYLFEAGYDPQRGDQIYFVNASGVLTRKTPVYFDAGILGCSIDRLFPPDCPIVDRLDLGYSARVRGQRQKAWFDWLLQWPNVRNHPPIAVDGRLSAPFKYILEKHGSKVFLKLLKDNLKICRFCLGASGQYTIQQEIGSVLVSTEGGGHRRLRGTVLPLLKHESAGYLRVLDLEDPQDSGWDFLSVFGVLTQADLRFYIKRLKSMKKKKEPRSTAEMRLIYASLGQKADEGPKLLLSVSQEFFSGPFREADDN